MSEYITFNTGRTISPDNPTTIAPGTAVSAFTVAEQNAKNRLWELDALANPANLPSNLYRAGLVVDCTTSTQNATLFQNGNQLCTIPVGRRLELWRSQGQIGTEALSVIMAGTTAVPCLVQELSYI